MNSLQSFLFQNCIRFICITVIVQKLQHLSYCSKIVIAAPILLVFLVSLGRMVRDAFGDGSSDADRWELLMAMSAEVGVYHGGFLA